MVCQAQKIFTNITNRPIFIDRPSLTLINAGMAKLVDALDLGSRYWGFESLFLYKVFYSQNRISGVQGVHACLKNKRELFNSVLIHENMNDRLSLLSIIYTDS